MRPSRRSFLLLAAPLSGALICAAAEAAPPVRVGGTGMALAAVRLLAAKHATIDRGIDVAILPSLGTPGGINALLLGEIDIATAARRLKPEETAKGLREGICFVTPMVFATSHRQPQTLSLAHLPRVYDDPRPSWPDGTPIKVILRSRSGSEVPYLSAAIPGLKEAFEAVYKRPGIPVGATDQENADLAQRAPGSLAITTLLQIRSEQLSLAPVAIDGVVPTAKDAASGAYPLSVQVCLATAAEPSAETARLVAFARSVDGRALLESLGAKPIE